MAVTQYQIFCRYLNETVNRALTNHTNIEWIGAEEKTKLEADYAANEAEYLALKADIVSGKIKIINLSVPELKIYNIGQKYEEMQDKTAKDKMSVENCIIEPENSFYNDVNGALRKKQAQIDLDNYEIITEETSANNPKYDMVFIYDGMAYAEGDIADRNGDPANQSKQTPYLYYDRMKRLQLDPWFLYSTHASLNSAMAKAKELANLLGKDAVKIGKIVPLDQYIDIV